MKGAGGGPIPKPADQKRNRNPLFREAINVSKSARVDVVPPPSFPFDGMRLTIWQQMWASPLATLWADSDIASLTRMVMLQTTPATFGSAPLLAETRQLEDRFLLNPQARAQLRVHIVDDEGDEVDSDEVSWLNDARARLRGTA